MPLYSSSYAAALTGGILKTYYEPGLNDQIWNDKILMKRLQKNKRDIHGGAATIFMRTGRNPGIGAAANGATGPALGQPEHDQATIPLKYVYGRTYFTGPDVANTEGNKGAFVSVMSEYMERLLDDLQAEINRQLHGDGSGCLALCAAADDATPITVYPYLWSEATKFLNVDDMEFKILDITDFATLTPSGDAAQVVLSTTTGSSLAYDTGTLSGTAAGDMIGRKGGLFVASSGAMVPYEVTGIAGAVHNTNLVGDTNWYYDLDNSQQDFVGPEGQNYDLSLAATTNYYQGVAANSNPYWRSKVMGNSGVPRALTIKMLNDMFGHLTATKGAKPSLILSSYQLRNRYFDLMAEQRRHVNTMTLDGGFDALEFNGRPWVVDQDAARGTIYFLDESTFSIYPKKDFQFFTDGKGNELFKVSNVDAWEVLAMTYMQLGCRDRGKNGKIIDLLET